MACSGKVDSSTLGYKLNGGMPRGHVSQACTKGWHRPCTCGRKRPRDSGPEQTHSVAATGETDRSHNENSWSGARDGNDAERSLPDESGVDTEWQEVSMTGLLSLISSFLCFFECHLC